jgi:hypothetical protein
MKPTFFFPRYSNNAIGFAAIVVFAGCMQPHFSHANSIINDQIAEHFDQVFFTHDDEQFKDDSWLPGEGPSDNVLGTKWAFDLSGTWVAPAGLKGRDGDMQISHFQTSLSVRIPMKAAHNLTLLARSSNYYLDESFQDDMGPFFDFDHITEATVGALYTRNLTPNWDILIGAGGLYSDGNGANQLRDQGAFLLLGAVYRITPKLRVGWGSTFTTSYYDGQGGFPTLIFDWIINDRNQLSFRDGLVYSHALSRDWRRVFTFSVDVEALSVKLREYEHKGEELDDPYLTVLDVGINLGYRHRFNSGLVLETKLGIVHGASHIIVQQDEDVTDTEFDLSAGLTVGLSYPF